MKIKNNHKSVKTSFTGGNLTNYSGLYPIYKFMKKLGIDKLIETKLSIEGRHNQKYSLAQIFNIMILGLLGGMDRLLKIEHFSLDPLIHHLYDLNGHLDIDTIRYRFKKFGFRQNNQLIEVIGFLSNKIHRRLNTKRDILDLDSTVQTVYGKQEGAKKGFNPRHKGKRSYHPLLAFLNSTKECIAAWLRPGDAYTANNADAFLKQVLSMIVKQIRFLIVRADSGFFNDKVLSLLESYSGQIQYLVKVKLKNLEHLLKEQDWESIPELEGWEMSEFYYRAQGWSKPRRFVALRKFEKMVEKDSLFPYKQYTYFCYVTNIEESPLYIHHLYGDRGESENWIEAVKNQLYAGMILTKDFWVNETFFLLSVLAYNISVWFRKLTDEKAWRQEPHSFRLWFIQLAGKITKSARQVHLRMYSSYYYKSWWSKIDSSIDALSFT